MPTQPLILSGEDADETRRPAEPVDDAPILWREIAGGVLLLLALFLTLCLVVGESENLIGPVGSAIGTAMTFLFGGYVAYIIPTAIGYAAVRLLMRKPLAWPKSQAVGVLLATIALCGFLALPTADMPEYRQETFARAGAFGAFLVEWEGLRLVGGFGTLGAGLILGATLFTGVVLSTGVGITLVATRLHRWMRERRQLNPQFAGLPSEEDYRAIREERSKRPIMVEEPSPETQRAIERIMAEPTPLPVDDQAGSGALIDNDAEAALRALEAAEMDREFEAALKKELEQSQGAVPQVDEPVMDFPAPDAPALKPLFTKGNPNNPPLPIPSPRAQEPLPVPPPGTAPTMDDLIEFARARRAQRDVPTGAPVAEHEVDDDARARVGRLFGPKKPDAASAAREALANDIDEDTEVPVRPFRERLEELTPDDAEDDGDLIIEDELPAGVDRADDPLFDPELETRPKGGVAARKDLKEARPPQEAKPKVPIVYRLPDIQLLEDPPKVDSRMSREEMLEISTTLEKTFADFGISAKVVEVKQGPVVTRFELKPAAGVKVSRIASLEHDLAMALKAVSVRILAPIPGKAVVGIEVPNRIRQGVYLKELIASSEFWEQPSPLTFALGKTIEGLPYYCDLRKMPHLLIAGATGTGKSVCLNSIIASILYRMRPDQVRMIMVDPKRVELSIYDRIPHLLAPVVCEPKRAAAALAWAVEQMEERYKTLVEFNVRNIDGYNAIADKPHEHPKARGRTVRHMPHMVIIVDELADLMITAKAEVEESIQRLAQMARAVGIHLILATQRPSVNVITGIIKANFPSRVAFQVSQKVDSRTILDQNGAEALLGRGDMLIMQGGMPKPFRLQGSFLSDQEVERITDHWRAQSEPMYEVEEFEPLLSEKEKRELGRLMGNPEDMDMLDGQTTLALGPSRGTNKTMGKVDAGLFIPHVGGSAGAEDDEIDEALVRSAARVVLEGQKGSTSLVQRRLKVGFARAGRLMDMLEDMGIVGPYKGSKPRDILVDCQAALVELNRLEGRGGEAVLSPVDGDDDVADDQP